MNGVGHVYLVGAGPGAADLLTLRAVKALQRADAVLHDRLVSAEVLALARTGARLIFVGKEGGGASVGQAEINRQLIAQARLGRTVVRLKGGDPFMFGRGGEEALALKAAGVPFEIVPGITSGVAAPALAGIPVTHRGIAAAVTFASGHLAEGDPDWAFLARAPTLVLFMGTAKLAVTAASLIAHGRSHATPVALIEAASLPSQRVVEGTLAEIAVKAATEKVGSPSLLVLGEVVRLRHELTQVVERAVETQGSVARQEAL